MDLGAIRTEYRQGALDEAVAGNDPVAFFRQWLDEAEHAGLREINAMTLATADAAGRPHARTVLLKSLDTGFTFFTNYESDKALQIAARQEVALLFFWEELERQVRVEGIAQKVSAAESDAYFRSRPAGSRIGAWASPQSRIIAGREALETMEAALAKDFEGKDIPRPAHWGGYRVLPERIEFWQGRPGRLHDRILFVKEEAGGWQKCRLAP